MEMSKILSADLLDIVFDGRNKTYGAYDLRKTYPHRLREALLITIAITVAFVAVPHLLTMKGPEANVQMFVKDVSLEDLKKEEKKLDQPPPPPPPKQEPPKVEITKFTPPRIVKDEEVKEEDVIKEVSKLEDTKIGTVNQEGEKDQGLITAPLVETKSTGVVQAPKQEEDYDKVYTVVEIPAEFPGGREAWTKYLERNLNRDLPIENGAPAGKYVVTLSFIVDKNGLISDVQSQNDPGYGTKDEAIRVIKKGPNWKPAVQNGRNVIYRHIQNIIFVVAEQ
jgi:protein TonB